MQCYPLDADCLASFGRVIPVCAPRLGGLLSWRLGLSHAADVLPDERQLAGGPTEVGLRQLRVDSVLSSMRVFSGS